MHEAVSARDARARTRRALRRARRRISAEQRAAAERALARRLQSIAAWRRARSVAVYMALDGEPSLERVAEAAARQGKSVYAPVVSKEGLVFAAVLPGARLKRHCLRLFEPQFVLDPRELDLVLVPLVGFDQRGARLGMGLGRYERAFRFLRRRSSPSRPKLVGVAFSFQELPELDRRPCDVPLWAAVTESRTLRFR